MGVILEWIVSVILSLIQTGGYAGVLFLMALESANIPIPSEIIMPFSGFLVSQGIFSFFWVVFWGATGNLLGSLISYFLGVFWGRPFLQKYGKFLLIKEDDLGKADNFFQKYGSLVVFWGRMLPVLRTFISFPAGVAKMSLLKFSLYTFVGSFFWSWALTYIGFKTGENWRILEPYFWEFDWFIGIVLLIGIIWWIRRHIPRFGR